MTEKIKIFHFISSLKRGGRERQLSTIFKYSNKEQFDVKIILLHPQSKSYVAEYQGIDECIVYINAKSFWLRLMALWNLVKTENPHIIYTWGSLESLLVLLLTPFAQFKFINGSIRHGIVLSKWSHRWRTMVLHLSKNIISNSHAGLKANGLKRGYVLYNGLDEQFFVKHNQLELKKTLISNVELNSTIFISVANLVPYKDYFTILESLKTLSEKGYSFYYLILGEGPMLDEIKNTIIEYNLETKIQLIGNVVNVAEYLAVSDVFIHSSKGEGCSNAILEAMAAGLAIVASDTGGTSEIVSNKVGYLFEYKNSKSLLEKLLALMKNSKEIQILGSNARDCAHEKFSSHTMMTNYEIILNQILDK